MRVTILRAGVIAAALARAWITAGHEVTLGVGDTSGLAYRGLHKHRAFHQAQRNFP
jgi:predicted dinucleotide-binding enzyme